MTTEVAGLLAVLIAGGLAVAWRMGWRLRLLDRIRVHSELRRATKWFKTNRPSDTGTWTGQEWLDAQEAVGGRFFLYLTDLRSDESSREGSGGV